MLLYDKNKKIPLYEQLFIELRNQIKSKELPLNSKLKPIRVLAKELNLSNNTVTRAYEQLIAEGYIRSVHGSGYYVGSVYDCEENCEYLKEVEEFKFEQEKIKSTNKKVKYDFCYENMDSEIFPWNKWRKYMNNALVEESCAKEIPYENNKGNFNLRIAISQYLFESRGVNCNPKQIIICPGTQYAMDVIINILNRKNLKVAFEDPGFEGMRKIFEANKYSVTSIPVTKTGIDVNLLEKTDCNMLYMTPSHNFPTGAVMSLVKKIQVLEWVRRCNGYIIENDYDNEFSIGKTKIPPLIAMDRNDNVIYISTLSKILSPSLRCAYIVLPEKLVPDYDKRYESYYSFLPTAHQIALANFILDGNMERHVRKVSVMYYKKNTIFLKCMAENLPKEIECTYFSSGSHVLMKVSGCKNEEEFIKKLYDKNIRIYGTKKYWKDKKLAPENIFLIGYSAIKEEELEDACIYLCNALKEIL